MTAPRSTAPRSTAPRSTALHVFDMDGTLLRGSCANHQLAVRLGCVDEVAELDAGFSAGTLDPLAYSEALCLLYRELTPEMIDDAAAGSPWIEGIDEVCADIAARGETSMLITMSPEFFARYLHRRGVDVVHGALYPPPPFTDPLDPAGLLFPEDKVRWTATERARIGVGEHACVAYGDSISDGPLFAALDNTVAVNADPAIEAASAVAYRGGDLREAYAHGRALLERA